VPIGIVWILRKPIRSLVEGIRELVLEYKGAKVSIRKPLDEFAEKFTQVEEPKAALIADLGKSTAAATTKADGRISITGNATVTNERAEKAKAFRHLMGRYLENFDLMLIMAAKAPVPAMSESWRLLKKTIVETAELYGLESPGAGGRDTNQALFYLTTNILGSQDVMARVYLLVAAFQKVEKKPDAEVSVRDAQDFIRYCKSIVTDLSLQVDKLLTPEGSS